MSARAKGIADVVGRTAVHPFPARMAPGIALRAIPPSNKPLKVLDPMMGSGTVLAVARAQGHKAIGIDLDPLAVLISRVWTTPLDRGRLLMKANVVLKRAKARFTSVPVGQAYPRGADRETKEFIRYWFDGYSRRQLFVLSEAIARVRSTRLRDALWCAFSRLIITKQAGASLAMDLSHSRPHRVFKSAPAKPFQHFLTAVQRVADSVMNAQGEANGPAVRVYEADARRMPVRSASIDLVLTSPPYLNAIDYIRCSKFSLVWMRHSVRELSILRGRSVGTEIGEGGKFCTEDVRQILHRAGLLNKLNSRGRAILSRYIFDMKAAMTEVARVLVSRGQAIYVIGENTVRGTYIRTAEILTVIAESVGLQLVDKRTRVLPANRRYLPPPRMRGREKINLRMRKEVIICFRKRALA